MDHNNYWLSRIAATNREYLKLAVQFIDKLDDESFEYLTDRMISYIRYRAEQEVNKQEE